MENVELEAQIRELKELLKEAVEWIKLWHGPYEWEKFYNSDEMKKFREVLDEKKTGIKS